MNKQIKRAQQGFTLIELMIVIAILGILIAIALPAYQDYSIRTKNAECLNVAAAAKLAVAEYQQSEGVLPGAADPHGYAFAGSDYCATVAIGANGLITATTQATGATTLAVFTLTPAVTAGSIEWTCAETAGAPDSQIPSECR
jgi:prepilin-type N-terminal cleavage/methylation domain-containing protein